MTAHHPLCAPVSCPGWLSTIPAPQATEVGKTFTTAQTPAPSLWSPAGMCRAGVQESCFQSNHPPLPEGPRAAAAIGRVNRTVFPAPGSAAVTNVAYSLLPARSEASGRI